MTTLQEKPVKVRKEHKCIWCGGVIWFKETAIYRVYIFEGNFMRDYLHPECFDAMNKYEWYDSDNGFDPYSFIKGTGNLKGDAI